MDQFGNLDATDLQRVYAELREMGQYVASALREISLQSAGTSPEYGIVEKHASKSEESDYGVLAIQVKRRGGDTVWVRPQRQFGGQVIVPPIGSFVRIVFPFQEDLRIGFYTNPVWFDGIDPFDLLVDNADNEERIGFVDPLSPDDYGGKRLLDVRENTETQRLIYSSDKVVIGEDDDKKRIDITVDDDYEIAFRAGSGGKVKIVAVNNTTDAEGVASGGSIDFEVDLGTGGKILLHAGNGGEIELKAGTASLESAVLGDTLKAKIDSLIDEIKNITVSTIFGPTPAPVLNAAALEALKTDFEDILSSKIKVN